MHRNLYSNTEFSDMKERINKEIRRRSTFRWWDPLVPPTVGSDLTPPLTIPSPSEMVINDKTYTINTPSEGSLETTRNIRFEDQGDNPVEDINTSSVRFDIDEIKNYLVGLAKIQDINLFYGRDEQHGLAFRDPQGIEDVLKAAEDSELNRPLLVSTSDGSKFDPLTNQTVYYPREGNSYIMPSGESDGEELLNKFPDETNFFDDHGAQIIVITEDVMGIKCKHCHHIYDIDCEKYELCDKECVRYHKCDDNCIEDFKRFLNEVCPENNCTKCGECKRHIDMYKIIREVGYFESKFEGKKYYECRNLCELQRKCPECYTIDGKERKSIVRNKKTPDGQIILVSDSNFKPINPFVSPVMDRTHKDQDNNRNEIITPRIEGGIASSTFGSNPRNPNSGNQYRSRPVFGGVIGACNVACTGLCYMTCDNTCSESCTTTCWSRCGNACTASCGNICTGCNTMCYQSCKTKCENSAGYACLNVGAQAVKITARGKHIGSSGEPGGPNWPKNTLSFTTYTCVGCAYTCQFWPNKRTTCWDAGCQGSCFTSCNTSCSTTCFGGCVDNPDRNTGYKTGVGRACSMACTVNCIGTCQNVCEGGCIIQCFDSCKALCYDNCSWKCHTNCGSGCALGCTGTTKERIQMNCNNNCESECGLKCSLQCTGTSTKGVENCGDACGSTCRLNCGHRCDITCMGTAEQRISSCNGCTFLCRNGCDTNCLGWGCRAICGIEAAGACEANCRLNCMGTACTSLCSDACSSRCSTCAFNCGFQCGPCTSKCSTSCGAACNINCSEKCQHSCDTSCQRSCTEDCGGCSNLCYSCVGMCIGVCSVKCENGCSSCSTKCGSWCDSSCGNSCFANCSDRCINTCSGSCMTFLQSNTTAQLVGPDRPPTAEDFKYPDPQNREEERYSFRFKSFDKPPKKIPIPPKEYLINIGWNQDDRELNDLLDLILERISQIVSKINLNDEEAISKIMNVDGFSNIINKYLEYVDTLAMYQEKIGPGSDMYCTFDDPEYQELYEKILEFKTFFRSIEDIFLDDIEYQQMISKLSDFGILINAPKEIEWIIKFLSIHGGVWSIDEDSGFLDIVEGNLPGILETMSYTSTAIWGIILYHNPDFPINVEDINIDVPFGFRTIGPIIDESKNIIILVRRIRVKPWEESIPVVAK